MLRGKQDTGVDDKEDVAVEESGGVAGKGV